MTVEDYVKELEKALKANNYNLAKQILSDMEKDFPAEN